MKKASKILFLIGGIYSVVCAVALLATAIVLFVLSAPEFTTPIIEGIKDGTITTAFEGTTPEEVAQFIQAFFIAEGVMMIFIAVFVTINAVISFMARKNAGKGMMIANVILGAISLIFVNLVGGILGLLIINKEKANGEFVQ